LFGATRGHPLFESFDMPDTHESCPRRSVTTSPIQALNLLNSPVTQDWARSFAGRVLASGGASESDQIHTAWRLAYGRPADASELGLARSFLARQTALLSASRAQDKPAPVPDPLPRDLEAGRAAAWVDLLPRAAQLERVRVPELSHAPSLSESG
jgi:hypothetical protein